MRACLVAFVFLFAAVPAYAGLGIVGGWRNSSISSSELSKSDFTAGGVFELALVSGFAIHTELRYVNKSNSDQSDYEMLALPILGQFNFGTHSLIVPHIQVGPDFSFKLSGPGFKSTDFAWDFGAGLGLELIPLIVFTFDIRYSLGLDNVVEVAGADGKTRGWEYLAGVQFSL